jgi:hypothetical protein
MATVRDWAKASRKGRARIGEIRERKGGKFKKIGKGKWIQLLEKKKEREKPKPEEKREARRVPPKPEEGMKEWAKGKGERSKLSKLPRAPKHPDATPPPGGRPTYNPDPMRPGKYGKVTNAARVGVCGGCVIPPGDVPRLPNLKRKEREIESKFAQAFLKDPDGMTKRYLEANKRGEAGHPGVFGTDDVKELCPDFNPPGKAGSPEWKAARARHNALIHQTANAIAKRALVSRLDELAKLPEGDPRKSVLVTSGGCAAGKGYAIGNNEQAKTVRARVGATWDAAGEQNGTENPWILEECKKRGIRPTYVYVEADPKVAFDRSIGRAEKSGRMVDARLFADSHAIGAKNFRAFRENAGKDADFIVLKDDRGKLSMGDNVSDEMVGLDPNKLYEELNGILETKTDISPAIRDGATIGMRIWGTPPTKKWDVEKSLREWSGGESGGRPEEQQL